VADTPRSPAGPVQFPCAQCGSRLVYAPGTSSLRCPSCGSERAIPETRATVEELDLEAALAGRLGDDATAETLVVKCASCAAESTLTSNVEAGRCPFCGTPFVATALSKRALKPHWLLPFRLGLEEARRRFREWVAGLWFAPNRLTRDARAGAIDGVYIPHWTFDAEATSHYTGLRGDDYTETERYTAMENGRPVTHTRTVTRTRWSPATGTVFNRFDDVLVVASRSLPPAQADALLPWDLPALVPYRDEYLSGFRAESYQVGLGDGFAKAKTIMEAAIRDTVCRDIGGDHQQIQSLQTRHDKTTFKHVLLPIWISSYRYGDRTYRFLVNARTGEVQGERPWSWIKITLAVLAALIVIAVVVAVVHAAHGR
jgi:DNA-directed RNA polymerase subunit RPC12/RpoP